jgi:hypothetical protein
MTALDHIEEGFVYHDGESKRLYTPGDVESAEAVLLRQCVNWGYGEVLRIHACLDTSGPSVSVEVTLLGYKIGSCSLSPSKQDCSIGGSIDGFKAEVKLGLQMNPLALVISGKVCAPVVGCKSFSVTIPFGLLEDA